MSLPSSAFCDGATRVLLAVVDGCRTYAELIDRTGLGRATIHHHLDRLQRNGLVAREKGTQGTLRPLVHERLFGTEYAGTSDRSGPGDCANSPGSVARPTEEVKRGGT